jgi:hypothetical protein
MSAEAKEGEPQYRDWFMRLWTPNEEEAGHFHLPMFFMIEKDTLQDLTGPNRIR